MNRLSGLSALLGKAVCCPWRRFLEIPLEIRPLGEKQDSGNFPGNLTRFGKKSRPCLLDLALGTPQNLEMPLRASKNCDFGCKKVEIIEKLLAVRRQEDTKPDPYRD